MDLHLTPAGPWRAALVSIDVFLGPFPAMVPDTGTATTALIPRFSLEAIDRIAQVTAALADGVGTVVRRTGEQVELITLHRDGPESVELLITPGDDGRYGLPAPFGQWQEVDERLERDEPRPNCYDCACSERCAACAAPAGGPHLPSCVWALGSAKWERPEIAAAPVVLDAHRHRPGCRWVRRRPGPLFSPGRGCCMFCGHLSDGDFHTVSITGGLVHHQFCPDCCQRWSVTAL